MTSFALISILGMNELNYKETVINNIDSNPSFNQYEWVRPTIISFFFFENIYLVNKKGRFDFLGTKSSYCFGGQTFICIKYKIKEDKTLSFFFKLYWKGKNKTRLNVIHYLVLQVSKSQMFENLKEHLLFGRI